MKKINRSFKLFASILCLTLLLLLPLTVSAAHYHVVDDADLLTESEEASLAAKLDALSDKYEQTIMVITTNDLNGETMESYSDNCFSGQHPDHKKVNSGILLLIYYVDNNNREYLISTYGDAHTVFSDRDLTSLEHAIIDYLKEGDYDQAFNAFADKCEYIIKYDKRLPPIWIIISLTVGIVIAWITINSMKSKHKSVKMQRTANSYMQRESFRLDRSRNVFLFSHVTRVVKPRNNSSSSGRRGSSGGSVGRRGGRF